MKEDDLLSQINIGLKNPILSEEVFTSPIKLSHLRKIDKIFSKGLHFYVDPQAPIVSKEASIFFRKQSFNSELNIGARKIVNLFEEEKISLSVISTLSELTFERKLPFYNLNDQPEEAAKYIRSILYPSFNNNMKEFLKGMINKLADYNVLVYEFIETWNKIEKSNVDGFYLSPNVIVLKRQQKSFRREIFTLAHELGHYLLNEEEIEYIDYESIANDFSNPIERWCNDFAYYYLIGEYNTAIKKIVYANSQNDYCHELLDSIKENTHLSKMALYTKLLLEKKITPKDYKKIKEESIKAAQDRDIEDKKKRELEKSLGIKKDGRAPVPIKSPLLIKTIRIAYLEGVINEAEFCKRLAIKPKNLNLYLQ